ncbi:hypothetical protein B0T11DRAFT_272161 [Plectosphaerella cucumerina]|jgi:hypothetical protein|uniref:Uncharacterized protein n=1 Tax=Plectosphaerella cucumerina TaxID=40658 RepID=A0A8K0X8W2_9PEZI|nr:hypothetical protein B0T11DRAFT_272161 [Plectosphaerella cucumerina]
MTTISAGSGDDEASQNHLVIPNIKSWPWWSGHMFWVPPIRRSMQERATKRILHLINMSPRPVTQTEVDALADLIAEDMARRSFMQLGILLGGTVMAARSGFRLPFKKLDPTKYREQVFPSLARPWVMGPAAMILWFTARATAYSLVIMAPAALVQGTYGVMAASKFLQTDPRLTDFRLTVINKAVEGDLGRDIANLSKAAHRMSSEDIRQQSQVAQDEYERLRQRIESGEGSLAKVSPEERKLLLESLAKRFEAGQKIARDILDARENPASVERQRVDYQSLSGPDASVSAPSTTNTLGLPPKSPKSPSPSRPAPEKSETSQGWDGSSAFGDDRNDDLDDASPIAYNARRKEEAEASSAWERVRQQAQQGRSPSAQNGGGGGWGSSVEQQADTKKQRNAQDEFDELVDQTRRG